jgi:phosphohistidine phosphatase SixA
VGEGGTKVLLLRHASAGERLPSPAADRARRLDRTGRADSRAVLSALAEHPIERVVASPHTRCRETVEPLARRRGLDVECREALAPATNGADVLKLLEELAEWSVVCTHREVFERLFHGRIRCEKGGIWTVEVRDGRVAPIEYLPPASSALRERALSR